MRARRTRRTHFTTIAAALSLAALVAVLGAAQAAPSTKVYDATVRVKNGTTPSATSAVLTLTLTNATRSKQTLGSANFTALGVPNGITLGNPTAVSNPQQWTVTKQGSNVVAFRSTVALKPSESVSADVPVTMSSCTNARWSAQVKQSNDFSGTGNDFSQGTSTNLLPLGRFDVDPIGTKVDNPATTNVVEELFVPQVAIPDPPAAVRISAFDVCGSAYANYAASPGPGLPTTFGTGATLVRTGVPPDPPRLVNADIPAIVWSSGTTGNAVGTGTTTVNPLDPETGDQLVVDDQFTDIERTSNQFDVVEKICTVFDSNCHWDNGKNNIHVDAVPPAGDDSLGIGFTGDGTFSCDGTDALGDTLIYINPRDYELGDKQTVTLTYDKTIKGTSGPVTNFQVCLSKDNGEHWGDPIDDCTTDPLDLAEAPCIVERARVQGNLAITLFFDPHADPLGGAR